MKKVTTILFILLLCKLLNAQNIIAQNRANALGKGMNISLWLESPYPLWTIGVPYPDANGITEKDIKSLHDLCFNSIRLPVSFEGFALNITGTAFDKSNAKVVKALNLVDSVIKWTAKYNLMLVIDNHIADDNTFFHVSNFGNKNLQEAFQLNNNNYKQKATFLSNIWKLVIARYGYANADKVIFEIRNEPNEINDTNLKYVYNQVIKTIRKVDNNHTLVVGNSHYYDAVALAASIPYNDANLIYTFHIYDNGNPSFAMQGTNSEVHPVDTIAGASSIKFDLNGSNAQICTQQIKNVKTWSVKNNKPIWFSEFGTTTLPSILKDDASRCNYIKIFGAAIDQTSIPWAYWDGYRRGGFINSYTYNNPPITVLEFGFSIFDRTEIFDALHVNTCFAQALHLGNFCK